MGANKTVSIEKQINKREEVGIVFICVSIRLSAGIDCLKCLQDG